MPNLTHKPAEPGHVSLDYRPEIDGLRALSVLSVFIFHLNHAWLPGGFAGVDVFFVISGYLITSIIHKDCRAGNFSLVNFYQRRIARIFPAFFVVAMATFAGAAMIYHPRDFAFAGTSLATAALSVINVKLMTQGNYFKLLPDSQPYLHYWSLAVEEQFYIFFPVLFLVLFKRFKNRLVGVLAVLALISFFTGLTLTPIQPIMAFYLLPTRAWELLAGCLLAIIGSGGIKMDKPLIKSAVPAAGLFLVLASFLLLPEGNSFPGAWPLLPVSGAVTLLAVARAGWVGKLLSTPALVAVGRRSYSLYLVHWPIFALTDYKLCFASAELRFWIKIGGSLLACILSYQLIERPMRTFLNQKSNVPLAYIFLAAAVMVSVPLGMIVNKTHWITTNASDVLKGGTVYHSKSDAHSLVMMGDSNASMYGVEIKRICQQLDCKFTMIGVVWGDPLPGGNLQEWSDSLAVVRRDRPDCLVFICRWELRLKDDRERFGAAVQALEPWTKHLIIVNQPPLLPRYVNRQAFRAGFSAPVFENAADRSLRLRADDYIKQFNLSNNCSVIDITSNFMKPNGELRFLDDQGKEAYADGAHLSGWGARMAHDQLAQAISKALAQ